MDVSNVDPASIDLTVNAQYSPGRERRRFYKGEFKRISRKMRRSAGRAAKRAILSSRPQEIATFVGGLDAIVVDEILPVARELGITRPLTQHERVVLRRYNIDLRTIAHEADAEEVRANA